MAHKVTERTQGAVHSLCCAGVPHDKIAKYLGISKPTLYKYYQEILDTAKLDKLVEVARCLFVNATDKMNVTAQIFYLKTQGHDMGWSDNQDSSNEDDEISKIEISVVKPKEDK